MLSKLFVCFAIFNFLYIVLGYDTPSIDINPEIDLVDLEETPFAFANKDYTNIVAFVDANCDPCVAFTVAWNALPLNIKELGDKVKLSIVDCTVKRRMCFNYGIRQTPTIRYYRERSPNNNTGVDIPPGGTLRDIFDMILEALKQDNNFDRSILDQIVNRTLHEIPQPPPRTVNHTLPGGEIPEICIKPPLAFYGLTPVQHIFPETMYKLQNQPYGVLVGFYDMLCKPSHIFVENWKQLAISYRIYSQHFIFAAVDCQNYQQICDHYGISALPSIFYIPRNSQNVVPIPTHKQASVIMMNIFEVIQRYEAPQAPFLQSLLPYRQNFLDVSLSRGIVVLLLANTPDIVSIVPRIEVNSRIKFTYAVQNKGLGELFRVQNTPALIFLKDGKPFTNPVYIRNITVSDISYTINRELQARSAITE